MRIQKNCVTGRTTECNDPKAGRHLAHSKNRKVSETGVQKLRKTVVQNKRKKSKSKIILGLVALVMTLDFPLNGEF